jgi:hypothetical protein
MAILRFLVHNFSKTFPIFDIFVATRRSFQKVSDNDNKAAEYSLDMEIGGILFHQQLSRPQLSYRHIFLLKF